MSLRPHRGHEADVFCKDALVQGLPRPISLPEPPPSSWSGPTVRNEGAKERQEKDAL